MARFIKGIFIGAMIGAVVGILYAPRKGSKTRKRLRQRGKDFKDTIKGEIGNLEKKMNDKYRSIKEDTEEILEQNRIEGTP